MKPQSCLYYLVDGGIGSPSIADDYFAVMQRVEQRLEIIPELKQETKDQVINVLPTVQLLAWVERLARPQLCQEERLEIVESLKQVLCLNIASAPSPPLALLLFSNLLC